MFSGVRCWSAQRGMWNGRNGKSLRTGGHQAQLLEGSSELLSIDTPLCCSLFDLAFEFILDILESQIVFILLTSYTTDDVHFSFVLSSLFTLTYSFLFRSLYF